MNTLKWISFCLLILLAGCTGTKVVDTSTEATALMQTSRDWSASLATGNVETIVSYWADDAVVLAPDMEPMRGKEAIRGFVEGSLEVPGFSIWWEPQEAFVSSSGEIGYLIEHGQMTWTDTLGNINTAYNKTVTIWKKQADGSWKCAVDTWNNSPAPGGE